MVNKGATVISPLVLALTLAGVGFWMYQSWQVTVNLHVQVEQEQNRYSLLKRWVDKAKHYDADYYAERLFWTDMSEDSKNNWQQWAGEQAQLTETQMLQWQRDGDLLQIKWQVNDVGQALAIGQAIHKAWMLTLNQWQIESLQDSDQLIVRMEYQIDVQ